MIPSIDVPYQCPDPLPSPLPTVEEIENAAVILSDRAGQRLVAVGEHYVIRYGLATRKREGLNLFFAETTLGIPVPHLYAMFSDERGRLFIVMQQVIGANLHSLWPTLENDAKSRLMSRLKAILEKMRAFSPSDTQFFGSIDGGCVPHHLFWTPDGIPAISGPFQTEQDFNMGLVNQLRKNWAENNRHSYRADYFARNMNVGLKNHRAVFTHGDLQRKNILVREEIGSGLVEEDFDLVLVDWEDSGWFPSYWEYFAAFTAFRWDDDWPLNFEQAIKPCPVETAQLNMIYQDLFY